MLVQILTAIAPIAVALVGIIPAMKTNRKKMQESIEAVQSDVKKVQSTLNAHIREDEETNARNRRYRILRFNDEICDKERKQKHSESHYEDILEDCDEYTKYADSHKSTFRNHRGQSAIKNIKDTYDRLKASGEFEIKE